MSYYLFQHLSRETLETEYKEFSYKVDPEVYYELDEINNIVLGRSKLDKRFNKSILDNLEHYAKFYIPKYISAFCNAKVRKGRLMIGVDDLGEVVGIPYLGKLPLETIKKYIIEQIHNSIITTNATMNYILANMDINIETLSVRPQLITSNIEKSIDKVNRLYQNYKREMEDYQKRHDDWYTVLAKYSVKLVDLVKFPDVFKEIFQYIADRDPSKLFVLTQDIGKYMNDILEEKNNVDNILYWVCKFRDEKVDVIITERPVKPKLRPRKITYAHELIKLSGLRKSFLENHADMKYYLLTIEMPSQCPDDVFYKDIFGVIQKKTRIMENGEPVCG